jgi:hypothetical protein
VQTKLSGYHAQGGNIIMEKIIKVGQMPGRIVEVAVEVGSTVGQVLEIAGLDATGYQIKMDGVNATLETTITETSSLVLLAKLVKGNTDTIVKIGVMPGRVQEVAVSTETTYAELFTIAEVNPDGYEVKADGVKITDFSQVVGTASLVLLAKQVKGNSTHTVKIGVMPGRVQEFVVESYTPFSELFALADVDPSGYEVKADGVKVTDFNEQIGSTALVLLAKQVKGN